jgi:hypothetical protein
MQHSAYNFLACPWFDFKCSPFLLLQGWWYFNIEKSLKLIRSLRLRIPVAIGSGRWHLTRKYCVKMAYIGFLVPHSWQHSDTCTCKSFMLLILAYLHSQLCFILLNWMTGKISEFPFKISNHNRYLLIHKCPYELSIEWPYLAYFSICLAILMKLPGSSLDDRILYCPSKLTQRCSLVSHTSNGQF